MRGPTHRSASENSRIRIVGPVKVDLIERRHTSVTLAEAVDDVVVFFCQKNWMEVHVTTMRIEH